MDLNRLDNAAAIQEKNKKKRKKGFLKN